ncbi:hypothetical protein ABNR98_004439 [Salmonella enterica]
MKHVIAFLVMFAVFGTIGQHLGSLVFLSMRDMSISNASPLLLYGIFEYYQDGLLSSDVERIFYISVGVSAAVTIIPPLLMMIGLLIKPKQSLHGDARFANERELTPYIYDGEYK